MILAIDELKYKLRTSLFFPNVQPNNNEAHSMCGRLVMVWS